MKIQSVQISRTLLAIGLAVGGLIRVAHAEDLSAFQLITEGNRYVGEQSRDKVVQIRSERSTSGLTPNVWFVVFYDPTAALKAAEVKFVGGKMVDVSRPLRLLEPISGADQPLDRTKLKVDSNKALQIVQDDSTLKNVKLYATQLKLERVGEGVLGLSNTGEPVWKVKLWAKKVGGPSDKDIGEIWISANDGKVVKNDLHVDRLN
jgi:hypothetical protein